MTSTPNAPVADKWIRWWISGSLSCSILFLGFEASGQIQPHSISADELVRRTVANELAAMNAGGHYQYRFEEHKAQSSETRNVLESRSWSIDRLILKNERPLTPADEQREQQRLRCLVTNPRQLEAFQKEQLSRKERFRAMVVAFPKAFSCRYENTADETSPYGLVRIRFQPNHNFIDRSWELRPLQGMDGTLWIDADKARLVRVEAGFFRDVEFGGGILGRIEKGGSFAVEQQAIGNNRMAITSVALHFNKRVLLARIRVDSVTKASDFQCLPAEMTLREGVEQVLK